MRLAGVFLMLMLAPLHALAADVSGTWTSTFDTQVGQQTYTYVFSVNGAQLTGKAKSANREVDIQDGKVTGDDISFVEKITYEGRDVVFTYTGKVVSADEIRFTRDANGLFKEDLVAKRAK